MISYIRAWKNLKGMSSDKRDSAVIWNKMNLSLTCGNLVVHRKFWQTNCKPFKIEKWDYILNLHTYIYYLSYILFEAGSWEIKIKSWRNGFYGEEKCIHCGSQTKRHRKPKFCVHLTYYIIWSDFVCCWHIRPGYKVIRYCFLKKHAFLF